jgi:hypothetical protein
MLSAGKRGQRLLVLFFSLAALLAIGLSALWTAQREPQYKGRDLSEWATLYQKSCRLHDSVTQSLSVKWPWNRTWLCPP